MSRVGLWQLILLVVSLIGCSDWRRGPTRKQQQESFDASGSRFVDGMDARTRSRAETTTSPDRGRVHAKARFVWIRKKPEAESEWLGYITLGQSLALSRDRRTPEAGTGSVCATWVPVAPRGWVCVGRDATLDAEDPEVVRLEAYAPDIRSPWPFEYAKSLETVRYRSVPSPRDQRAKEGNLDALLGRIERARAARDPAAIAKIDPRLVGVDLSLSGNAMIASYEPPAAVLESDDNIPLGSTIAYVHEFDHDDRAWLLSWDHAVIPRVRVQKFPRSEFHGAPLEEGVRFPLGFVRKIAAKKYRRAAGGALLPSEETFAPRARIAFGEGKSSLGADVLLETDEAGTFVRQSDVFVVDPKRELPRRLPGTGRRTWVEVSTVGGWLVAYEGERPVYVTLISAGRAALGADDKMVPASSTPNGVYAIHSKLKTATMRSENRPGASHAEVMYTQVFFEDYALHGAYWHDAFGDRKSAGCVNLSPIDSKWLFDWSEPSVPEDWHVKKVEPGEAQTVVVIHS